MQIKLLGNSCNEEALSEFELSRGKIYLIEVKIFYLNYTSRPYFCISNSSTITSANFVVIIIVKGGYTKVARSKTEVSVEKEEKLKLDAIIYLGQHRVSILQLEW